MDERLERVYARWCARSVLHLWDAPEVVRDWLGEGAATLRDAAAEASKGIVWRTYGQAGAAARLAALAAVHGEVGEGAWDDVWDYAREVDWEAAIVKRQRIGVLLAILPDLLRTHGLAARLLDDAREDPWLTREVVRALALPDLGVWCDWYKQMEDNQ